MNEIPDNSKLEGSRFIMPITDEEIMGYADGVLPPDRRAVIREALAKDPALMERLESFLLTRDPLARVFDEVLAAPIPARLLEALQVPATPPPPPPRRLLGFLYPRGRRQASAGLRVAGFAVAVVCAAILGAWLAAYAARYGIASFDPYEFVMLDERGLVAMPALHRALDRTASGEAADISTRLSVRMRSTFLGKQHERCREFDLDYRSGAKGRALACRFGRAWRVETASVPPVKSYGPAIGNDPSKSPAGPKPKPADDVNEVVDAVKQRISSGKVVTPAEEKDLIARGWADMQ